MSTVKALGINKVKALGLNSVNNENPSQNFTNHKYIQSGYWISKKIEFGEKARIRFTLSNNVDLKNGWVTITLLRVKDFSLDEQVISEEIRIKGSIMEYEFEITENLIDNLKISDIESNKGLKYYFKISYLDDSYEFEEKTPLVVKFKLNLCSGCKIPEENFPYTSDVYPVISRVSNLVKFYSNYYKVPDMAIAGSIADEYNTRKSWRIAVDWFQDEVLINWMPNFAIEFDSFLNVNSKFLNATKHDLGIGNIKLETAKKLYQQYPQEFKKKNWDYTDLVDYIRSDEGSIHIAAIVIRKARSLFDKYISHLSQNQKEAVYVTYYKQGDLYYQKFLSKLKKNPNHKISPGEDVEYAYKENYY